MPELPEVNTVMKYFKAQCLNKKVINVSVADDHILRNSTADEFSDFLEKKKFVDTYRQGKYFFGLLTKKKAVLFHLGMTGDLIYYTDESDRPKHERFKITFKELTLGYSDPRKFSHILILDDYKSYLKEIGLGPDALKIKPDLFAYEINRRNTSIKAVLLNQKVLAGVGNLYADEICFQTKIHPGSVCSKLTQEQIDSLYINMQKILKLAVRKNAYYKVYPEDWFWKWRESGKSQNGWTVKKAKIAGRTTYWVDELQPLFD